MEKRNHPVGDYLIDCVFHGYSFFAAPRFNGSPWFLVTLDRGWAALSAKSKLEVDAYMVWRFRLLTFCVTYQSHVGSGLSRLSVSRKVWRMAKMGRPPIAERDYRGEFITVRLRPGEKRAILQAARKAGAQYTDWARSVLLSAARRASGR